MASAKSAVSRAPAEEAHATDAPTAGRRDGGRPPASAPPALAASPPPVAAAHGMVVTAQHLATEVGVDVLKQGGNAVDAAVAVGYALAVVYPAAGNLGGGGFMTIRSPTAARPSSTSARRRRSPRPRTCTWTPSGNVDPGREHGRLSRRRRAGHGRRAWRTRCAKYGTMTRAEV